jgi:peptide/nickel transport system permease protein
VYLGPVGCRPPGIVSEVASWGTLLAQLRLSMTTQWWVTTFPGLTIALTVLCVSFLGDGLRDALDPRDTGSEPLGR